MLQATSFTMLAVNGQLFQDCPDDIVYSTNIFPIVVMILTMTAGTSIIMWLGELITDRGVGNGMSVLIFTQIAATFPAAMWNIRNGQPDPNQGLLVMLAVIVIGLFVMARVVYVEQAQRRIRYTPSGWSATGCWAARPPTSAEGQPVRRHPDLRQLDPLPAGAVHHVPAHRTPRRVGGGQPWPPAPGCGTTSSSSR